MLTALPWDLALHLPWHVVTSPLKKWQEQPSFLLGEYLFITCAAVALVHALRQSREPQDNQRRRHLLAWVAALLAGTANDLIFMALPLVDNFWQAQATLMITPRLPLYIPCVYVCFMYYPTVTVWRLRLPPLSAAALSGLFAMIFYAPYDIVGAKFLWWTWHDTDPAIKNRILGAPIGSTLWVLTFVACFAWLFGRAVDRDRSVARGTVVRALLMICGLCTVLMAVMVTALDQLDGGIPGRRGLFVAITAFVLLACRGWRRREPVVKMPGDELLTAAVLTYFGVLVFIMAAFEPATHRSASVHQTYGECHVTATDISGHSRYKYLCAKDFDEDFGFACVDQLPATGSEWYTVCGRPHASFWKWMLGVLGLGLSGSILFAYVLAARRRSRDGQGA